MTRKKFMITAAVISAVIAAIPFVCNENLTASYYDIHAPKLASPVKIAFLSDVHNTQYGHGMSELIGMVDDFAPEAVLFGGDLFDSVWNEKNSQMLIRSLVQRYPCYYALGNHEFYENEQDIIRRETAALGVNVLNGTYAELAASGGTVRFIGAERWSDHGITTGELTDPDMTNILLYHYPEDLPRFSGSSYTLILSGHAHGGQWRFPPLIQGVYAPGQGLLPKYTSGIYNEGGETMLVSRGLQRCPRDIVFPRIFNRPEAVFITLTP